MAHSLILGREIELLNPAAPIDSGPAQGAILRLGGMGTTGFDLGAGEPQTAVITSLLLDGERPIGRRTGNASIELHIYARGPSIPTVLAAREKVLAIVDQETWELVLQLEGMQPTVFDCLRAKVSMPTVITHLQQYVCTFSISCQRLPFGRSDELQTISIQAPPGTPGGGGISYLPSILLDGYESLTGTTVISGAAWTSTTDERWGSSGLNALRTTGASTMQRPITQVDLSSYRALRFWIGVTGKAVTRTVTYTLFDTSNRSWTLPSVTALLPGNLKYSWFAVSLRSTTPPAGFRADLVNKIQFKTTGAIYVDDLVAVDSVINVIGGTRAAVYEVHAIEGSARTPINLDINRPSGGTITGGIFHHPRKVPLDYLPVIQLNPATPIDGRTLVLPSSGVTLDPWDGTYTVCLAIATLVGGSTTSRTTSVTITQIGAGYTDSTTVARTYTPTEIGTAKYLFIDRVTLPIRAYPPDVRGVNWTVSINCTLGGGSFDSFTDLLFIDTAGETIVWHNAAAATHVYVDEPDPVTVNHGQLLAGSTHSAAATVHDKVAAMSGAPFGLDAGENSMLVHCVDGAVALTVNYAPRWHGLRI